MQNERAHRLTQQQLFSTSLQMHFHGNQGKFVTCKKDPSVRLRKALLAGSYHFGVTLVLPTIFISLCQTLNLFIPGKLTDGPAIKYASAIKCIASIVMAATDGSRQPEEGGAAQLNQENYGDLFSEPCTGECFNCKSQWYYYRKERQVEVQRVGKKKK